MTNNEPNSNEPVFDINNLPKEFVSYLDRERHRASETARKNAKKELASNEEFINSIKKSMQEEVEQTFEEKTNSQISSLQKRLSESEVARVLSQGGISNDDLETYTKMFATEDIDSSVQMASAFVSSLNNTINARLAEATKKATQNMATPQSGGANLSEQQSLQAQLDEARKDTSFMRNVRISQIQREASEKGIILK